MDETKQKLYKMICNDPDINVAQANELITAQKDDMTALESKLTRLVIAQVMKEDEDFKTYSTTIADLEKALGIQHQHIYSPYKKNKAGEEVSFDTLTTNLMKKLIYIRGNTESTKQNFKKIHWFESVQFVDGVVTFKLHNDLKQYLLNLNEFSQYGLIEVLSLSTDNSIKLFELLYRWANKKNSKNPAREYKGIPIEKDEVGFLIDDLKEYLNCTTKYKPNGDFISWVIAPSVRMINEKTILDVQYRTVKQVKKLYAVIFKIGINMPSAMIESSYSKFNKKDPAEV